MAENEAQHGGRPTLNVLLVTFSFPPAGGVGVLRALSLAKYLPENGLRVDVLTARNAPSVGKDLSLLKQVPEAVTVHRTWTLDLPFALRKGIKKLVSGRAKRGSGTATQDERGAGRNPLRLLIGNLLLPDPQVGWLPFAFRAARRIMRSRKIDVVLVTVPPFSTVRLVTMLRREFSAMPIILDFRDEWLTTTINLVSFNRNERARKIAYRAEAEGIRDASLVVTVTEAAGEELKARYPAEAGGKFRCIPNGFEIKKSVRTGGESDRRVEGQVTFTYIGSVYGSTDPETFVDAVLTLPQELRAKLRVRFIGHIETQAYRASLERLGETVELLGFLPQEKALEALDETDYLLLISHDRINVSAKFYDYLSGTKPMVAAVHPEGEIRSLLEATGAGFWADVADVSAIGEMLTRVLDGTVLNNPLERNAERIAGFDRRVLSRRYAELIGELVGQGSERTSALFESP